MLSKHWWSADTMPKFGFVEWFQYYVNLRTDADPKYAKFLALQILGHSLGKKWKVSIQPDAVWLNMFLLLVGPSSKGRKTNAQDFARDVYIQNRLLSNDFSPEGFVRNMNEKPQGYGPLGEFSKIIKQAKNPKHYMSTIMEMWNDLFKWTRPTYERILSEKSVIIQEPFLRLNSTCTHKVMRENVTIEMMDGGFLARWLMVEGTPRKRKRGKLPKHTDLFKYYFIGLISYIATQMKNQNVSIELTSEAYDRFDEISTEMEADDSILPFAARYQDYIIAIANLLYVSDYMYEDKECKDLLNNLINLIKLINLINHISLTDNRVVTDIDYSDVDLEAISTTLDAIKRLNISKLIKLIKLLGKSPEQITPEHLDRAYDIVKAPLSYAKKLWDYVGVDSKVGKLKEYLNEHPHTPRHIATQYTHLTKDDMDMAIRTLGWDGQNVVATIKVKSQASKRGRVATILCMKHFANSKHCTNCKIKPYCIEDNDFYK